MTILIVVALIVFGVFFSSSYNKRYANEPDPIIKRKMIRKGILIGFSPLLLAVLFWLGLLIYVWTHISGDL